MNPRTRAPLIFIIVVTLSAVVFTQSRNVPLQAGVSVQMPVTSNAVTVPNADNPDALVVALTADGTAYLGVNPLTPSALADRVKKLLSTRNEKTVYIKADGRVPYARVVAVIDALRNSGVDGLTLLTAQPDTGGRPVASSKGLEMRVVNAQP